MKNKAPNRLVYLLSSLELNNTSSYKNKQAFSFVEIIIVISIIALLSVMALTYYS
jgi:prepilin-type N-terminal cleavage/methylation domain-containing protein